MSISTKTDLSSVYGSEYGKVHDLTIKGNQRTSTGNTSWTSTTSGTVYNTASSADANILNKGENGLYYWLSQVLSNNIVNASYLNSIVGSITTSYLTTTTDSGSTDAYVITLPVSPGSYVTGLTISFIANTDNTGGATLNVNGLGAQPIRDIVGKALITGMINAGQVVTVVYSGSYFTMISASPTTQFSNDISIDVLAYGLSDDGTTDNLSKFNSLVSNFPYAILYFPYRTNGIYYFSGSRPDLSGIRIFAVDNVTFKMDANPNIKDMLLLSNLKINNTTHNTTLIKQKNVDYNWITANVGVSTHDIVNNETWSVDNLTTYANEVWNMSTGSTSVAGTATKTSTLISWASAFTSNPQIVRPASLTDGSYYEITVSQPSALDVRWGLIIQTSTNIITITNRAGLASWSFIVYDNTGAVVTSSSIAIPNGGAYGMIVGQQQNIGIYYRNSGDVYLMCSDYVLYHYKSASYGAVTKAGYILYNLAGNNIFTFLGGFTCANYKLHNQKPLNIAIIGDSIHYSAWCGLPIEKILPMLLRNINGIGEVTVTNYSVSGSSTVNWVSTYLNSHTYTGFDYVLVMLGTNDQQAGTASATYLANLTAIANKIVSDGSTPIFGIYPIYTSTSVTGTGVTTTDYTNHALYTRVIKSFCIGAGYGMANMRRNFGSNLTWYGDNIHPTEQGQIAIAKSWAEAIYRQRIYVE